MERLSPCGQEYEESDTVTNSLAAAAALGIWSFIKK